MPQVDFTLQDVLQATAKKTEEIVGRKLVEERTHIDARFDENLLATAAVITTVIDHMDERLDRVEGRLKVVEGDLREVKREVKGHSQLIVQHSQDIMGLRAAR